MMSINKSMKKDYLFATFNNDPTEFDDKIGYHEARDEHKSLKKET